MSVLFFLIPLALGLAAVAVLAFVWASRSGQFDDLATPPLRMLFDDVDEAGSAAPAPDEPAVEASSGTDAPDTTALSRP